MDETDRSVNWQQLIALGCLGVLTLVTVGFMAVVGMLIYEFGPPSNHTLDALKEEGNEIVIKLEDYKTRNGAYPTDLSSAGITAPTHHHGDWNYSLSDDRVVFTLWISHNGTLIYDPQRGWEFFEGSD